MILRRKRKQNNQNEPGSLTASQALPISFYLLPPPLVNVPTLTFVLLHRTPSGNLETKQGYSSRHLKLHGIAACAAIRYRERDVAVDADEALLELGDELEV